MLPQAIAFAAIAELPPQAGLSAAVVAAMAGALWGSSVHLHPGPTNSSSLRLMNVTCGLREILISTERRQFILVRSLSFLPLCRNCCLCRSLPSSSL
ncbi:MAG: SulP family inorganic anion transporter [Thermoplasmatota archaeon]